MGRAPLNRRRFGIALVVLCLVMLSACDWSMFRSGPARTGYNSSESAIAVGNVGSLVTTWTGTTDGGWITSSPAVANGVVYIGTDGGGAAASLYAYSADPAACPGTPKACAPSWKAVIGGVKSSPAVAGDVVYVGSDNQSLYAFDAKAGAATCSGAPKVCTPLWTAVLGASVRSSPVVANGMVYVASGGVGPAKLFAFPVDQSTCSGTPKTCLPAWTASLGGGDGTNSSPAVADGKVYVLAYDGLFAFPENQSTCTGTPKTCTALWKSGQLGLAHNTAPAWDSGTVYITSSNDLYAFNGAGCGASVCPALWRGSAGAGIDSSPAVANGRVYFGTNNNDLRAFDAAGCTLNPTTTTIVPTTRECLPLWTGAATSDVKASPAVANGLVFGSSLDGKVLAWAAADCASAPCAGRPVLWSAPLGGGTTNHFSSPAVANGVVYIGSRDGKLYAFGLP